MPRAVVVTALGKEFLAVRAHLQDVVSEVEPRGTQYDRGVFDAGLTRWDVLVVQVGMGNPNAAFETERAITHFASDVALFVGVAGGIKDVALGDVVAATKVCGYEFGKAATEFLPRSEVALSTYSMEQCAYAVSRDRNWQQRILPSIEGRVPESVVKPIAAGSKVIASTDSDDFKTLRQACNDAVAVEMEGLGFLQAVRANPEVDALVVRGISDLLDGKTQSDAEGWQETGARHAAAFAFEALAKCDPSARYRRNKATDESRQGSTDGGGHEPQRIWRVPHRPNRLLVGRDGILLELGALLSKSGPPPPIVTLHGLGGVGKTQIAVTYAFQREREFSTVWWLNSSDPTVLAEEFRALARALELPDADSLETQDVIAAVNAWLAQSIEPWLLIFDNAESEASIRPFLPDRGNGQVIVTSRSPLFGNIGDQLRVDTLTIQQGAEYLQRRTGSQDDEGVRELAEELGGLPLALVQAGAYVDATKVTIRGYLQTYGQHRRRLQLLEQGRPETDYPNSVATTWEVSFREIEAKAPAAAELIKICSFLAPDEIPLDTIREHRSVLPAVLADALVDDIETTRIIGELLRFSLMERIDDRTLAMHRLVQLVVRHRLPNSERTDAALASIKIIFQAFPRNGWDNRTWPHCERLLTHALAAAEHAEDNGVAPDGIAHVLASVARYFRARGYYEPAAVLLIAGLAILEAAFEGKHFGIGMLANDLGRVYQDLGRYPESQAQYERALALTIVDFGEDHANTAACHNNLGELFREIENLDSAISHLEEAVRISETSPQLNDPSLATSLGNLAMALRARGDFQQAWNLLKRSLEIDLAAFGPDSVAVGHDYNNIGQVLKDVAFLGRGHEPEEQLNAWAQQSEAAFLNALEIFEKLHKDPHSDTAIVLKNLGNLYKQHGYIADACEHLKRALSIAEVVYPQGHPFALATSEDLQSLDC